MGEGINIVTDQFLKESQEDEFKARLFEYFIKVLDTFICEKNDIMESFISRKGGVWVPTAYAITTFSSLCDLVNDAEDAILAFDE